HYIANLDGGAHDAWLKTVSPTAITLSDVAKGMIAFSSNANTDYLLTKLDIDKVNERLIGLKLVNHTPIYPLVSALYVPLYLHEEEKVPLKDIASFIKTMSMRDYIGYVLLIHNRLIKKPFSNEEKVKATKMLNLDVQKAISDKQSSSTTATYGRLMKMLNHKDVFPSAVYRSLDPIMEQVLEQEEYQVQYRHFGRKGGSTAFMLTDTVYATDFEGNTFELVFFANNLSMLEQTKLSKNLRLYYEGYFKELRAS
ncbi:hypothetical protein, partial [Providencia sp. NPDC089923]|uniref:hypothetical protein n=1 Tax=Providencia sp. NPDC089923 TaxID=3415004 RepID=UPI003C2B3168